MPLGVNDKPRYVIVFAHEASPLVLGARLNVPLVVKVKASGLRAGVVWLGLYGSLKRNKGVLLRLLPGEETQVELHANQNLYGITAPGENIGGQASVGVQVTASLGVCKSTCKKCKRTASVVGRPTKTRGSYKQMVGRVKRTPAPAPYYSDFERRKVRETLARMDARERSTFGKVVALLFGGTIGGVAGYLLGNLVFGA